ncbi:MAG: hypothetical protein RLZZ543_2030 [Bacteroidota bacterium]|jgi:O-antigen/teichoic acid export membrane protein
MGVIQRQGLQSTVITYSGILVGMLSLLVLQPLLLSPEEIGLTRVLFSFSFLVSTVLPMSAGNITTRYFPKFRDAEHQHKGFLGFILLFPLIGSLLCLPILFLFKDAFIALYAKESALFASYFLWVFPLSLLLCLISIFNNYLFSVFRPLMPALGQEVLIRLFFVALIVIYSGGLLTLSQFVMAYVGTYALQLALLLVQAIRVGHVSLKPDWSFLQKPFVKEMLIYGWTVFLAGIASMAIKLLDAIVLGQFVPLALVGVYGIASFIPTFIEAPVNALDKVANVRVAHAWEKQDMENIREIYYKSARYLFLLGGLLFILVSLNAPFLFRWLPVTYYQGVPVVAILSLGALFNLMTGSNTAIIFNSSRFTSGAIALVMVAVLNLVLLYVLIPRYGLMGAAWATCLSSLAYNLFKYLFIFFRFKLQPFDMRTLYIALAITAAYGAASILPLFGNVVADVASHSIIGSLVYLLIIWYSRAADDLKQLLPWKKK